MYLVNTPSFIQKLFPNVVWDSTYDHKLHLTFDDGPHPESTPKILALLDRLNLSATFFCLGKNVEKYPQLFDNIIKSGHQIGNHGYKHLSGWKTSFADYVENVNLSKGITGSDLYRPPYGRMTYRQYKRVSQDNTIIGWSLMPGDFDSKVSESQLQTRFNKKTNNSIIVLHDTPSSFNRINRLIELCY